MQLLIDGPFIACALALLLVGFSGKISLLQNIGVLVAGSYVGYVTFRWLNGYDILFVVAMFVSVVLGCVMIAALFALGESLELEEEARQ